MATLYQSLVNVSLFEGDFVVNLKSGIGLIVLLFIEFFGMAVTIHKVIIVESKSIKAFFIKRSKDK